MCASRTSGKRGGSPVPRTSSSSAWRRARTRFQRTSRWSSTAGWGFARRWPCRRSVRPGGTRTTWAGGSSDGWTRGCPSNLTTATWPTTDKERDVKIGIGLPNTVPGTEGGEMRDWAMRAEAAGFSSLGTIDRIVYGNHDPLIALAYAAAVTERIGLLTSILIAPLRANTALLAKQAASVDVLSGGRLTLGLAVGGREDDFDASGLDFRKRGATFDRQLDEMARLWKGEKVGFAGGVGPQPRDGRPEVVIGGTSVAAFRRSAQHAGWMMGGGPPDYFKASTPKLDAAWKEAGRSGRPRQMALGYFALGDGARDQVHRYITDYYGFLGDYAEQMAGAIPVDAAAIKDTVGAFEAVGCDELVLFPTSSDPAQVDLLAEAVL